MADSGQDSQRPQESARIQLKRRGTLDATGFEPDAQLRSLQQGNIGQLGTLVDLLQASSHDQSHHSDSDDSDSEDTHEARTPTISLHDGETSHAEPKLASRGLARPVRGKSLLTDEDPHEEMIRNEIALDNFDTVEQAIGRAQQGDENSFEDPKTTITQPKEVMLSRLVQEFGPWIDDSEEFIQQIPGALYRGVLIKGLLALTNRRFFIYAFIPPAESAEKILKSGVVTVHFPGRYQRKRRAWIELRSDSMTWYKSSTKKYKPIGACRLSQLKEILPYDETEPDCVRLEMIDGRAPRLELSTVESAIQWRREIEAALFTFRNTADKLRLSLPLQFITDARSESYMTLAERIEIEFDAHQNEASGATAENSAEDESSVVFGYIKTHADFGEALLREIDSAKSLPPCVGVQPILEIGTLMGESVEPESAEAQTAEEGENLAQQFVKWFALPDDPKDLFIVPAALIKSLPCPGKLAIAADRFCFWRRGTSLLADVKLRIPLSDIENVKEAKAFGFKIFGLAIQIHGSPDVRLDFRSKSTRNEVIEKLKQASLTAKTQSLRIDTQQTTSSPLNSTPSTPSAISPAAQSAPSLQSKSSFGSTTSSGAYTIPNLRPTHGYLSGEHKILGQDVEEEVDIPRGVDRKHLAMQPVPKMLGSIGHRKVRGMHFVCLTIGSRGDVQPYISLGKELIKDGNRVTIVSHPEYRDWVEGNGISYREAGGDPGALMKLSVEHKMFSPGFFRESIGHFRQWLDDLFHESWIGCKDADILIESPSTFAGIHIAEALQIPYFRAFTMPWTTTSTYPQAFAASVDLGPAYNSLSYSMFDSVIWTAMSGQVNKWRKKELGLKKTTEAKMNQSDVPFIYNFSSAVVPRPNDWQDHIKISGYWFLDDNEKEWSPPEGLLDFIELARSEGKSIIYVGFGSITVSDSAAVTRAVVAAVKNADVRVILSKGWSERGEKKHIEVELPKEIFSVPSIAHDRLFPLIDAACHHGGAGTTGASLRAGLPTLIHPFFGDQFFWSSRVQKLGAGLKVNSLTEKDLTHAFKVASTDRVMKEKAEEVGAQIRAENGPRAALDFIYDHMGLAEERGSIRAARAAGIDLKTLSKPIRHAMTTGLHTPRSSHSLDRSATTDGAHLSSGPPSPAASTDSSHPKRSTTLPIAGFLASKTKILTNLSSTSE